MSVTSRTVRTTSVLLISVVKAQPLYILIYVPVWCFNWFMSSLIQNRWKTKLNFTLFDDKIWNVYNDPVVTSPWFILHTGKMLQSTTRRWVQSCFAVEYLYSANWMETLLAVKLCSESKWTGTLSRSFGTCWHWRVPAVLKNKTAKQIRISRWARIG